jgi:hypothetical protein
MIMPATYVYTNGRGKTREIVASMRNAPPERVLFRRNGEWEKAPDDPDVPCWVRVYTPPVVDTGKVRGKYPFASSTLPHYLPGCKTDRYGRSIVQSKAHEDRICKQHGFVKGF